MAESKAEKVKNLRIKCPTCGNVLLVDDQGVVVAHYGEEPEPGREGNSGEKVDAGDSGSSENDSDSEPSGDEIQDSSEDESSEDDSFFANW